MEAMPDLMTFDILLLFGSGLLAGAVNAVAGGGTFFTFSALLAVGLPPVVANATSAVSVAPGSVASSVAYLSEVRTHWRRFSVLSVISLLGGGTGALILLRFSNDAFAALVPYLLLGATLLFALSPYLARGAARLRRRLARGVKVGGLALQYVISVYGGFFGAGMGIVMLAALAITEGDDFHLVNAAKNVLSVLIQGVAIVLFVAAGIIHWSEAFIVTGASIIGGFLGVVAARRVPTQTIRWFVIGVGLALSAYYFFKPA